MHLIDVAAAVGARRHAPTLCVTPSGDHIDFRGPVHNGDLLVLKSSVNFGATSSIEVGVRVEREQIPILPDGARLCEAFGLDPLGTIASGALLLAVAPGDAAAVEAACRGAGIMCAAIGAVTERSQGAILVEGGRTRPLPTFPQDEITKLFAGS